MMKYGSAEIKEAIVSELKDYLVDIMQCTYAKFFVKKLLKYGSKSQKELVFAAMRGHICKLVRHRVSVEIVENAYSTYANAAQRSDMAAEVYGNTFSVFRSTEDQTLQSFVETHPQKRDEVIRCIKDSICPLVDKDVIQHSFIHRLILDYFTCASNTQRAEMIETVREHVVHILHTHAGSRVTMMCLWHGTSKDRKIIIKSFKSFVVKICKEEFGHMVLLAMFDVVDDTKIVQKAILDEMLKSLDEVVADKYGRKVLLYLLLPRDPLHFHPDVVAVLRRGDNNCHSKKETVVRHNELLSHVSPPLTKWLAKNCREVMADREKHMVVWSIIRHANSDVQETMQALAKVVAEPFTPSVGETSDHIVDHYSGHLILKWLILNDVERIRREETVLFSDILVTTTPAENLRSWAGCNRGCFILVSLMEVGHVSVTAKLVEALSPMKSHLNRLKFKGASVLHDKLQQLA